MKLFKTLLVVGFFLGYLPFIAQTKNQIEEITKDYDIEKIQTLANDFKILSEANRKKALDLAKIYNWPIKFTDEQGSTHLLIKVSENNTPIYYKTHNVAAARSTRADFLHNGGGLGINVEGQGMTAHVWDIEVPLTTHNEYSDAGGGASRVSIGDSSTAIGEHATHVTGTIIAYGAVGVAKGMAPLASSVNYNAINDTSEAMGASSNGMLVSNHSYGYNIFDVPDWQIGAYTFEARSWDLVANLAPYYLMVCSAGNDGDYNTANGDPLEGNSYYDKLTDSSTAKNNMVVASGLDMTVDSNGNIIGSITRNSFSSEGPTDDYRIKPDIMGNGHYLYSCVSASNSSYASFPGTSMSSPNVAGSLLLLQQLYSEENSGNFMLSSTLKGLALHTADDGGMTGPDAEFGWGYMNTKKAAEIIMNAGDTAELEEFILNDGDTYVINVTSDNTNPLIASISWNDPASSYNNGIPNDTTPRLVNDLDIRLTQSSTNYEPWMLTSVNTNAKGDNIVDNFERVDISSASGTYELTISHKGTLNNPQTYSLILSGITESSVGVDDGMISEYVVWPNPSNGKINISTETNEIITITVSDLLGKRMLDKTYLPKNNMINQLDLSFLENGVYLISIEANGRKSTQKIIIE